MKNLLAVYALGLLGVAIAYGTVPAVGQSRPGFTRRITGVVVDKEEQPVAGAKVCAFGARPSAGRLPCRQSDANGSFAIDVDQPDTYTISAEDVAHGYPEPSFRFYGKLFCDSPVVTVGEAINIAPVKISLGVKAGRVIFTLLDEKTGKSVESGSITVCRPGDQYSCWSKSTAFPQGRYELLTPDVPFTIKFETWKRNVWVKRAAFDEHGVLIEVLQVDLGATKEMTVRLK